MIKKRVLNILACPNCKIKISYLQRKQRLFCPKCGIEYSIKNDIPVMLDVQSEKEIATILRKRNGREMEKEFQRKEVFWKIVNIVKKVISGEFVPFHPEKKMWDELINSQGDRTMILEIGSGFRRLDKKVINFDISLFSNVDIVGDAHKLPILKESFDTIWIEVVLEHVRDPIKIISEIYRVLKPGGLVYAVIPFICPYHGYPNDFQRYSLQGVENLFFQFLKEDSGIYRGPSVALVNFLSDYFTLFSFSNNKKAYLVLKGLALCLIFPLKYLDLLLIKNAKSHKLAHSFYFLGRKL